VRDAYLTRLGVEREPPSVDALFRLHRAHVERVAYETVWIHLAEPWGIDCTESAARISSRRRGGYCYHLNGGFSELLGALGYHVTRHVGGVHGPEGPTGEEMTNHLVLTVHDLPADTNPMGTWYVDVGLGDAMHDPIPLIAGTYQQGPFRLSLEETPGGVGDWHLTHDPAGTFPGMSWRVKPTAMDAFVARHTWLSTSPDSGFVKVFAAQRRDATGTDMLRGLVLKRIGAGASETTLTSLADLLGALGDVFNLDLSEVGGDALRALWVNLAAAHEKWGAAGRP